MVTITLFAFCLTSLDTSIQPKINRRMASQEVDWSNKEQAKSEYLKAASRLSTADRSLSLNADVEEVRQNGRKSHRKLQIVRSPTKALEHAQQTVQQVNRTKVRVYNQPWYFEIGRNNEEPYLLDALVQYDEVPHIEARRHEHVDSLLDAARFAGGFELRELLIGRNSWVYDSSMQLPDNHLLMTFSNPTDIDGADRIEVTLSKDYGLAIVHATLHWARPKNWQGVWDQKMVEENEYTLFDGVPMLTKRRVTDLSGSVVEYDNIVISRDVDPGRFDLSYYGIQDPNLISSDGTWFYFFVLIGIGLIILFIGIILRRY